MRIVTSDKGVEVDGVLLPDGRHVINGVVYVVKRNSVVAYGSTKPSIDWVLLLFILGAAVVAVILALKAEHL